ncbi:hypothetical protein AAG570_005000 [Ranatra chinensis]|uniref:Cytochrome P450 n=1 Tax=Ranatra chinensis TaxID=642074 RepID=A0ABD0XZG7_9HEMI
MAAPNRVLVCPNVTAALSVHELRPSDRNTEPAGTNEFRARDDRSCPITGSTNPDISQLGCGPGLVLTFKTPANVLCRQDPRRGMVCLEACLGLVLLVVVLIYFFGTRSFAWWDDQGVPYTRPWPFLGNLAPVVFQRSSYADCVTSLYERHCGVPLFGMFSLTSPSLVVKHPDLVQSVFKSRFESFPDRGILCDPKNDPLSANLFFLPLERWKWLRAKLVPVFSSAKLRGIVPLLEMSSQNMVATMEQLVQSGKGCQEARSLFTQYSLRVIATCAFGMDETSYKSLEQDFSDTVRGVFSMKSRWGIQQLIRIFLPDLGRRLKLPFVRKDAEDFFMGVVKTEMEARRKDPQRRETRRDFLALLMDIDKDQKEAKGEGNPKSLLHDGSGSKRLSLKGILTLNDFLSSLDVFLDPSPSIPGLATQAVPSLYFLPQ